MICARWSSCILAAAAITLLSGCMVPQARYDQTSAELAKKTELLNQATTDNARLTRQISDQDQRILSLLAMGDKRMDRLFHVKDVSLGDYTGGVDTNGKAGDDAIKVYLLPMDQDGSILKAAGDVKIQLYDLAAAPADNLIGEYNFSVDQIGKYWSSGFLTYHYSFVCPWKQPPQHNQITVRVEFVEYLTGRHFTAQKVCSINPIITSTQPAKPTSQNAGEK
jgi:hypothetical protein